MLYIIGEPSETAIDILDTDDMVVETITRRELNRLLRKGIQIANIDTQIALRYPRLAICINKLVLETAYYNDPALCVSPFIVIPDALRLIKDLFVYNSEYNFFFRFNTFKQSAVSVIELWFDGFYYEIKEVLHDGLKVSLLINNCCFKEFGSLWFDGYQIRYTGFLSKINSFVINFESYGIRFNRDIIECDGLVYDDTAIAMSASEFKRKSMYA